MLLVIAANRFALMEMSPFYYVLTLYGPDYLIRRFSGHNLG